MGIRILHLVHAFRAGGAERVLVHLCNFSNNGVRNIIGSFVKPDDFQYLIKPDRRDVRFLQKRSGNDWTVIKKIRKIVETENIDIVHAQGWGAQIEGMIVAKFSLSKRRPGFVFAFHGKTMKDVQKGIPRRRKIAQRIAHCWTDAVIAPAKDMAEDYAHTIGVPLDSIEVIHNGIDLEMFSESSPGTRSQFGISDDDFVIGFVGRLDPVKNLKGLLKIFSNFCQQIDKEDRRPLLLIVGEGSERSVLEGLVKEKNLEGRVLFTGQRNDVAVCMSGMDVYIQPSFYEGHSYTILEAMASGLPVISTDVGGTPEIIDSSKTGFLFEPADHQGMVNALYNIYRSPELVLQIGEAGCKVVRERFSVQQMVRQYEDLYVRLLHRRRSR